MSPAAQAVDLPAEVLPARTGFKGASAPRAELSYDDRRPGLSTVVPDGAYRGTERWSDQDVFLKGLRRALEAHPEMRRTFADPNTGRYKDAVKLDTFMRVIELLALSADHRTGRNVRYNKKKIAEAAGCSPTTVQRVARMASRVVQCLVLIVSGRQLTELERIGPDGVWRRIPIRGRRLKQHGVPPVWSFHVPAWLRPFVFAAAIQVPPVDNRTPADLQVHDAAPQPSRGRVPVPSPVTYNSSSEPTSSKGGSLRSPSGPGSARTALNKKRRRSPARELAIKLVKAWPLLRSTPPGRVQPRLKKFVESRLVWDENDLLNAIQKVLARNGRSATVGHIHTPWAFAGSILEQIHEEADHPRLYDDAPDESPEAFARAERELEHLSSGNCDAGWIHLDGGAVAKCPDCRPAMRATWRWQDGADSATEEPPW